MLCIYKNYKKKISVYFYKFLWYTFRTHRMNAIISDSPWNSADTDIDASCGFFDPFETNPRTQAESEPWKSLFLKLTPCMLLHSTSRVTTISCI